MTDLRLSGYVQTAAVFLPPGGHAITFAPDDQPSLEERHAGFLGMLAADREVMQRCVARFEESRRTVATFEAERAANRDPGLDEEMRIAVEGAIHIRDAWEHHFAKLARIIASVTQEK